MSQTRFRKRPVEVDAIRWTSSNIEDVRDFTAGSTSVAYDSSANSLIVSSREGQRRCFAGDWLVRENGEYYAYKNVAFEQEYEVVDVLNPV